MGVRQAGEPDAELVRDLRLRALADAPDAFGSTLDAESGRPLKAWRRLARGNGWGGESAVFIAEDDGTPVGITISVRQSEEPAELAHLYSMWVDPAFRRRGHAAALVDAAVGWAGGRGVRTLRLGATETNPAAIELYRGLGFAPTGESSPLREDSDLSCVVMERTL